MPGQMVRVLSNWRGGGLGVPATGIIPPDEILGKSAQTPIGLAIMRARGVSRNWWDVAGMDMTGQEISTWGSSMRWVLRLIETDMPSRVTGVDVMEISRPDGANNIADLGLTLCEASSFWRTCSKRLSPRKREILRLGGQNVRLVVVGVTSTAGDAICSRHYSAR